MQLGKLHMQISKKPTRLLCIITPDIKDFGPREKKSFSDVFLGAESEYISRNILSPPTFAPG